MNNGVNKVNIAYIDAINLNKAIDYYLKWKLDYRRFRVWLKERYKVDAAYMFLGYIPKYKERYEFLEECGFTLVFKDVVYYNGIPKGNCDADLIVQATSDFYRQRLNKGILVSSDGDYTPLIKLLLGENAFEAIISPAPADKCSILLKRTNAKITYIGDHKAKLQIRH